MSPTLDSALKLLLTVDDSAHARGAVELINYIKWPAGTSTHIMATVPERLPLMRSDPQPHPDANEALELKRWRAWAATRILVTKAAAKLQTGHLDTETEIRDGNLIELLLERSLSLLADMVVIGANRLRKLNILDFDETISYLTDYVNCAVLITRPLPHMRPLSTIFAVDSSAETWRAVKFLRMLSLPDWAKITVAYIIDEDIAPSADLDRRDITAGCVASYNRPVTAETCINNVIGQLHDSGVQAHSTIRTGTPADEILTIAKEYSASLIIMGMHDHDRFSSLSGSGTLQRVVREGQCSVMAVSIQAKNIYTSSPSIWEDTIAAPMLHV